jgi:hypothetical protein
MLLYTRLTFYDELSVCWLRFSTQLRLILQLGMRIRVRIQEANRMWIQCGSESGSETLPTEVYNVS